MRFRLSWLAIGLWALLGCEKKGADPSPQAAVAEERAPSTGVVTEERELPPPTRGQWTMHGRYRRVEDLRDALISRDLTTVQQLARGLDKPVAILDLPPAASGRDDDVPRAARTLLAADTGKAAAEAFSQMMLACGSCHRAAGVTWRFDDPALPTGDALQDHMQRYTFAVERMWEGLMIASEERFDRGAAVFEGEPLVGERDLADEHPPVEEHPPGLSSIAQRIHAEARTAPRAKGLPERARIFGSVLAGCANCHARIAELDGSDVPAPPR